MDASLVMRDRETDSWWGMIRGEALAGPMKGAPLVELPVSSKSTWREWRAEHPASSVLSVDGAEHVDRNPYETYFSSERTFRDQEVSDTRLDPKTPVYAFQMSDQAFVISHETARGGILIDHDSFAGDGSDDGDESGAPGTTLLFYRDVGAQIYASTRAYQVPRGLVTVTRESIVITGSGSRTALETKTDWDTLEALPGVSKLGGFDTYWYIWVAAHPRTRLLN